MIEAILNLLRDALAHNQFVQGGFMLAIVGGAVAYFRRLPSQAWGWLRSRFIVTLDVTNDDPAFYWIAGWLAQQPYARRARRLTVSSRRDGYNAGCAPTSVSDASEAHLPKIILTPAPGMHVFRYRGRIVWLSRERKDAGPDKNGGFGSFLNMERFELRIVGRGQEVARQLVEDARRLMVQEKKTRTDVYVSAWESWRMVDSRDPRPLSSVFLPDGQAESVLARLTEFMEGREWYEARGIPYRIGFLLHGLPGSGKTSLILALAGELRMSLYVLNLASGGLSDDRLSQLLAQVPPRSMVLLEDVDAAFAAREKSKDIDNKITFSGLLNALDGAASRDGWVVFMTTNHKDALDPALVRPGRADVHVEFDYATEGQARRMFLAWFPETDVEAAARFGKSVVAARMSMAEVQQHLLLNKDSPDKARRLLKAASAAA